MKISEMLGREDFYSILPDTINQYAAFLGIAPGVANIAGRGQVADLYINEKLNAIISAHPSQEVIKYLNTEYSVNGSLLRRLAVKIYIVLATHRVRFFSKMGLKLKTPLGLNDILIYPCNKKIRLFDFSGGIVYTILKKGYPEIYINREVKFRTNAKADFIPQITRHADGCYSESIIKNGKPLARIQDATFVDNKKKESLQLLSQLTDKPRQVHAHDYLKELKERCLNMVANKKGFKDRGLITGLYDKFIKSADDCSIELVTSHGDLQPGNIWIDSEGNTIIIDWETVKHRTPFYDYAALYCRLRNHGGLQSFCDRVMRDSYLTSIHNCPIKTVLILILAEELEYQTEELISLPDKMGVEIYISILKDYQYLRF